jgi:ribonucleotide reductase beta subunit family protein with ferritin-like domain
MQPLQNREIKLIVGVWEAKRISQQKNTGQRTEEAIHAYCYEKLSKSVESPRAAREIWIGKTG